MFTAMQNVVPSHLSDTTLFDFKAITKESGIINGGDIAFDKEEIKQTLTPTASIAEQYFTAQETLEIKELS
jgi:tRNA 2-thiocytidine biosynthesis protein TtcA